MIECDDELQLMVSKTGYESKMLDLKFSNVDPPVLDIYLDPIEEIIVEEKQSKEAVENETLYAVQGLLKWMEENGKWKI